MTDDERNFIIELEALSRKYKVLVGGCGCCGSPYLTKISDECEWDEREGYTYEDRLDWLEMDDYDWDEMKGKIVGKETN
jgi:hypothetical protein